MKILAIEHELPGATRSKFEPYLLAETRRVWELYQSGVLREIYFRADVTVAILMLECADVKEAQRVLDSLPLVQAGMITFEIIPLKAYPGFARLFGQG
jgi:hypothetical protein